MKRENKTKNYIILGVIVLIFVGLTLYFCKWYQVLDEEEKQVPVIRDTIPEITPLELDHYIVENPTATIYMCTASEIKCRKFEGKFKKLIERENLREEFVYLNLTNSDIDEFIDDFNSKYKYKTKLTDNYPAIVEFNEEKITHMLQGSKGKTLTIEKVKNFIDINKIGE